MGYRIVSRVVFSFSFLLSTAPFAQAQDSVCQMRFSAKPTSDTATFSNGTDVNGELLQAISGTATVAGEGGRAPASVSGGNKQDILQKKLPTEFSSCADTPEVKTAVWYEFLRGLSKIESDGQCSGAHGDAGKFGGKGSDGLFQMTKGDGCGGKGNGGHGEMTNPNDYKENIACAVGTWSRMLSEGKNIIGNPYWGPCKRGEDKCKQIIETINKRFCQGSSLDTKPDTIDWGKELGDTKGYRSGSSGRSTASSSNK